MKAWLIERTDTQGPAGPQYIALRDDDAYTEFYWTHDPLSAYRYASREFAADALLSIRDHWPELFRRGVTAEPREHQWGSQ